MPCDYSRYPRDWTEIRQRILERERNRCKWCRVENHSYREGARIVLTVAHLDHDPQNNTDANLAALCQRCHLGHDRLLHMLHARQTRERKTGQLRLGLGAE